MSENKLKLLIVDDDSLIIQSLKMAAPNQWRAISTSNPKQIPQDHFTAAFVDMHLDSDMSRAQGLDVIKVLHERDPHLEIVAMSGDLDRNLMENCLKNGATRFLAKPLSPEEVLITLDKIEALSLLRQASNRSTNSIQWIGQGAASREVQRQIAQLKGEPGPILIEGESGTGKEVAATLIHNQDGERPFISVNVAALPENIFESEMFGHVRGAFTGADQNKMGLIEAAHNGDLFLDEIEALPLSQQAKLLRFLESGELRRVGAKEISRVNVRVIAATNQNLNQMVKDQKFREDLLWRLNGKKLLLPPLRQRKEDIEALSVNFLERERPRRNKTLSPDAIQALNDYDWPGNVRELKRVCEQLSLHSPLPFIRAEDVYRVLPSRAQLVGEESLDLSVGLNELSAMFEARVIRQALKKQPDIDLAAQLLQISRSSLYKKIKDYNIESGT